MTALATITQLRSYLAALEESDEVPRLDIQWLRLRCEDTLRLSAPLQRDSIRQLQKDVSNFAGEFPGLIPPALVEDICEIDL